MRHRLLYFYGFLSLIIAIVIASCVEGAKESDNHAQFPDNVSAGGAGGGPRGGGGAGGDECFLNCDGGTDGTNTKVDLVLDPTSASLTVNGEGLPTQSFKVTREGVDVTQSVAWTFERPDIGDIQAGSTFTPTGDVGGKGELKARLGDAEGTATVSVYVHKTIISVAITPEQRAALDNPSGGVDPKLSLVYPNNETVFPLGVLAPEVMWGGGDADDLYKLTLTEEYYSYSEYFKEPPPSRHFMAEKHWENLSASGQGAESDPVSVSLTRLHGASAFKPKTAVWHIAQGSLKGSVYYWELPDACGVNNGRILRVKPDSDQVDEFWKPGNCWGCHTVSRDGKTMMATYDTGFPFPMVTIDLAANPAAPGPLTAAMGVKGTFSAFNEKGDKALISNDAASSPNVDLKIIDTTTGMVLNSSAITSGCAEPAWSPDGKKIAGICNLKGQGWAFDSTQGDLTVADVAPDGFTTSNVKTIVPQAGANGRPAYPSFSPGSEWIAFGRPTAGSRSTGSGDLWIVAPDGGGLQRLALASGDNRSFNPVFAPLRAGGYFWVAFLSRRDYGNRLVAANRQQIWITAITDPPTGGGDPSHPAFYMRGQEACGKSENAYFALDPCKDVGEPCKSGVDCCGGTCVKNGEFGYACGDPPDPGECASDGNACQTDADCCNSPSSRCVDSFCEPPVPK